MKKHISSLATKKIQIKITLRCNFTIIKLAEWKENLKTNIEKTGENEKVWERYLKSSYTFWSANCEETHKI